VLHCADTIVLPVQWKSDILFRFSFYGISVSAIYNLSKETLQLNYKFSIHN